MHILLIEDNKDLAANVWEYLEARGHVMDGAGDGVTGLHLAVVNDYDAIVLDIGLPGIDGVDLCQKLRREAGRQTPVLMLTARDTLADKLGGFGAGADDYLVKPFELQELEARLLALHRRGASPAQVLHIADLTVDTQTLQVRRAGRAITLTPTVLKLLMLLARKSPRAVPRADIERELWGDGPPDSDALRTHVHALRAAIDRPFTTPLLHTLHGIGYRLGPEDP